MYALRQSDLDQSPRHPAQELTGECRGVLNALRVLALECRALARTDLFKACAMLAVEKAAARDAHARALLKCFDQAMGQSVTLHRPGEVTLSFDEAWLMRAIQTAKADQWESFEFLIRSRIPKAHRRHMAFLIRNIALRSFEH